MFLHFKWLQEKRERQFNDAEKCDLVDITCKEETTNADGDQNEPVLVKLRSKTIFNKQKTSLYRSVAERLAGGRYEIRNPKGIKRMRNLSLSDYIRAKDVLKAKSEVKTLKTSPWVNTIARRSKSSRQLKQKFSHTRKTQKNEAVDS